MALQFSAAAKQKFEQIRSKYPTECAALLPALYLAQEEFGYVSLEAMEYVAKLLNVSPATVYGVATFYTMYNKAPVGKHLVQVCMNLPCALRGAEEVFEYISKKLGVKAGETTKDGKFTLMKVECLGACGNAPMMQVNDKYYEDLTPAKVDEILGGMK
jgi:NADH-quinone oxidoreductase subunit E